MICTRTRRTQYAVRHTEDLYSALRLVIVGSIWDVPYKNTETRMQYSIRSNRKSLPVLRLIDHLRVWLGH